MTARAWILIGLATTLLACESGLNPSSGLEATIRIEDAQYTSGAFPVPTNPDAGAPPPKDGDAGAPELPTVDTFDIASSTVNPGQTKTLNALVSSTARTVAVGIEGDPGYWVVPVAEKDVFSDDLGVHAVANFAQTVTPGPLLVWFAAANVHGQYGPARPLHLFVPEVKNDAALTVELTWSADMDLDLIVIGPDGSKLTFEGYYAPDGSEYPYGKNTPQIDLDSNVGCQIDGHRRERATYPHAPKAGRYDVYVRLANPCGLPSSGWKVRVWRNGKERGEVVGTAYAYQYDTPNGGLEGPGVFATSIDVN